MSVKQARRRGTGPQPPTWVWIMYGKRLSIVAPLALLAAVPAAADVKDGVDAWTRGDYARAIREWEGPAAKGDADAQFNLGQAYKLGRGVKQDLVKAEDFYAKAAAQGHLQAADNLGLLLFQRGEKARALPYLQAAAGRGDPRSQYLIGVGHFNGDFVAKDWVRAYALTSLARQAGLPQATSALAQMDQYIPLEQRQQGATLAAKLAAEADVTRARQLAAADLGALVRGPNEPAPPARVLPAYPGAIPAAAQVADNARRAGADRIQPAAPTPKPAAAKPPRPAPPAPAKPAPSPAAPPPAVVAGGPWKIQLGAFAVPGNAEAQWNRVKNLPELAGRTRQLVGSGHVTRLLAGGFAGSGDAQATCRRLSRAGISCLPVRN